MLFVLLTGLRASDFETFSSVDNTRLTDDRIQENEPMMNELVDNPYNESEQDFDEQLPEEKEANDSTVDNESLHSALRKLNDSLVRLDPLKLKTEEEADTPENNNQDELNDLDDKDDDTNDPTTEEQLNQPDEPTHAAIPRLIPDLPNPNIDQKSNDNDIYCFNMSGTIEFWDER